MRISDWSSDVCSSDLPLVVSNLVNIVSADFFHIGFGEYALVMVPVDLAAIAVTLAALLVFFGKDIPRRYEVAQWRAPAEAIQVRATFRSGGVVLALLPVGFFVLDTSGVPVSAVAADGLSVLFHIGIGSTSCKGSV